MSLGAWVAVLKAAEPRLEEWEAEALFAVLDADQDGLVSAEEFLSLPEVLWCTVTAACTRAFCGFVCLSEFQRQVLLLPSALAASLSLRSYSISASS